MTELALATILRVFIYAVDFCRRTVAKPPTLLLDDPAYPSLLSLTAGAQVNRVLARLAENILSFCYGNHRISGNMLLADPDLLAVRSAEPQSATRGFTVDGQAQHEEDLQEAPSNYLPRSRRTG
jgi:hypothetical protein